ncbi:BTB/POZ domain-containing protein 18 [Liparis tanakae]|uniref:BTB/POZ domain-containing protein 18 n=1 Tax=Liparis tanakae TaxID=230148 RepID=A0A4Z2FZY6_9TELE|nr:BTB/POZ domain-containing protein 18 [Liparis tanakae]
MYIVPKDTAAAANNPTPERHSPKGLCSPRRVGPPGDETHGGRYRISVPTHSCILAALSPYLSQKLSASPPPPSGEKRELCLQAVTARTLLKLVGLLYSGEVEVKGSAEQNDLLAAACRFGIAHLVEGQAGARAGEGSRQNGRVRSRREEEDDESGAPRTEGAAWRNAASPIEERRRASAGRRSSSSRSIRGEPPASSEPERAGAEPAGRPAAPRSQSAAADRRFFSPPSSLMSDGEFAFGGPTDPTPTSSAFSFSLDDDSSSARASAGEAARPTVRRTNGKPAVVREDEERPRDGGEARGRGGGGGGRGGKSAEMRHARPNVGIKSLAKLRRMQQMMEKQNTQISIKPGPTRNPEPAPTVHPAAVASPERQLDHGLDHGLDSPPPPQPPGPADECDEQIEKLLEDIMMGLNILPNLDRDCKKPHCLQPSHGGAEAVCREPAAENEQPQSRMHGGAAGPPGCEYYPDFGTQIGHTSTDPGIQTREPRCYILG